jgi:hypothetical protein
MTRVTKARHDRPVRDLGGRGLIQKRSAASRSCALIAACYGTRPSSTRFSACGSGVRRFTSTAQSRDPCRTNPCADNPVAHDACAHFNLALASALRPWLSSRCPPPPISHVRDRFNFSRSAAAESSNILSLIAVWLSIGNSLCHARTTHQPGRNSGYRMMMACSHSKGIAAHFRAFGSATRRQRTTFSVLCQRRHNCQPIDPNCAISDAPAAPTIDSRLAIAARRCVGRSTESRERAALPDLRYRRRKSRR